MGGHFEESTVKGYVAVLYLEGAGEMVFDSGLGERASSDPWAPHSLVQRILQTSGGGLCGWTCEMHARAYVYFSRWPRASCRPHGNSHGDWPFCYRTSTSPSTKRHDYGYQGRRVLELHIFEW